MFFITLVFAILTAFILVAVIGYAINQAIIFALFQNPPAPRIAGAKPGTACSPPAPPAQPTQPPNANTTGGVFYIPNYTLPQGVTLSLTADLTIITDQQLIIDGTITHNPNGIAVGANVSITLVSLQNNVTVNQTGLVGQANVPLTPPAVIRSQLQNALARGNPGTNAGTVTILAPQGGVDIQGFVDGFGASDGGNAVAVGTPINNILNIPIGGGAIAVGAQAGAGGDVRICALDGINIDGEIRGGWPGTGGAAVANAQNGADAYAEGGPSNAAGDVHIQGLVQGMAVTGSGKITGGAGFPGGDCVASGGNAFVLGGGDAIAKGAKGGNGGTVAFTSCVVTIPPANINAHAGGNGANATSRGGRGANIAGGNGGDATSNGGDGGADGAIPQIPTPTSPPPAQGGISRFGMNSGTGGIGNAKAGSGGTGNMIFNGGSSGTSTATGGTGAVTGAPPAPVPPGGPVPPTGATGGTGPTVTAPGSI